MPSLRSIQQSFSASLTGRSDEAIEHWLDDTTIAGRNALQVYRNNVREAFLGTLETTYPVLHRLVGPDYFRQMASKYQFRYPSRAGNLLYIGESMPQFLQEEFGDTVFAYFIDIAHLEWACQLALVAADCDGMDRTSLAKVAVNDYPALRFGMHPSVRLLTSIYPVFRIWRSNQPGHDEQEQIDLAEGGDCLLVRRDGDTAEIRRLEPAQFNFLKALAAGVCLADAHLAAEKISAEFDLAGNLENWVAAAIITRFSLDTH